MIRFFLGYPHQKKEEIIYLLQFGIFALPMFLAIK